MSCTGCAQLRLIGRRILVSDTYTYTTQWSAPVQHDLVGRTSAVPLPSPIATLEEKGGDARTSSRPAIDARWLHDKPRWEGDGQVKADAADFRSVLSGP